MYEPTVFPAYTAIAGTVADDGLWSYTFDLGAGDLTVPIAATIIIDGAVECVLDVGPFGCFAYAFLPDLDARLLDLGATEIAASTCVVGDCGKVGRQETLAAMPTTAGTYTIEIYPWEGSPNDGEGGDFDVYLSSGPDGSTPPPVVGSSVGFSGDDRVVVADDPSLQITGDLTYELWIRPDDFSVRRNPLAKALSGEGTIFAEVDGTVTFFHGEGGGNTSGYEGLRSTPLASGVWSHVVITRTASTLRWYINGVADTTRSMTKTPTVSPLPLVIGGGYAEHVAADGASLEDSVGYRAFVMDLLAARVVMGDPPQEVVDALQRAGDHLARLGVKAGPVPHFGDWDRGTAMLGVAGDSSPESSLRIAAAALATKSSVSAIEDGSDAGGGIGRLDRAPWKVWLKAGSGSSHEHADLLSVAIQHGTTWVIGDPGNGSYNRSLEERNYFRTSIAHNVIRVDGLDQREPHRRFRWVYHPNATLGSPIDCGAYRVMWGSHDAYERLDPPRTVVRACPVASQAVVVADWIGGGEPSWELSLPLRPDVVYRADPHPVASVTSSALPEAEDDTGTPDAELRTSAAVPPLLRSKTLVLADGTELGLLAPGVVTEARGSHDPFDGWWADDYDTVEPATRLNVKGVGDRPIVWALWTGVQPDIKVAGDRVIVAELVLRVTNTSDGMPRLVVEST